MQNERERLRAERARPPNPAQGAKATKPTKKNPHKGKEKVCMQGYFRLRGNSTRQGQGDHSAGRGARGRSPDPKRKAKPAGVRGRGSPRQCAALRANSVRSQGRERSERPVCRLCFDPDRVFHGWVCSYLVARFFIITAKASAPQGRAPARARNPLARARGRFLYPSVFRSSF